MKGVSMMPHLGHHIRIRLQDDRVIATTAEQRRLVARVVLHHGLRYNLVAMALADSHLHMEAVCDRIAAGRFAHGIEASLRQRMRLPVAFVQYPPKPIRSHRHFRNTFKYILTQHQRHGLPIDLLFEASNVPDLLGLRLVGRYTLDNVRRWLPRVRRTELLQWLSLSEWEPADGPLDQLEAATLAALCLDELRGSSQVVIKARRAMVEILGSRVSNQEVAQRLGVGPRTLRGLRRRPADPELVTAIRLQLGYRAKLMQPNSGAMVGAVSSLPDML
jgi:hypothetical protein